jgi:hypothetical protein
MVQSNWPVVTLALIALTLSISLSAPEPSARFDYGAVNTVLLTGVALFTHTRWPSAVAAHIAGYDAGVLLVSIFAWRDRPRGPAVDSA